MGRGVSWSGRGCGPSYGPALCLLLVFCTLFRSPLLVRIMSSWCQCLDLGWRHDILCLFLCWKKVLLTVSLKGAQFKESLAVLVHFANSMMTDDRRPSFSVAWWNNVKYTNLPLVIPVDYSSQLYITMRWLKSMLNLMLKMFKWHSYEGI